MTGKLLSMRDGEMIELTAGEISELRADQATARAERDDRLRAGARRRIEAEACRRIEALIPDLNDGAAIRAAMVVAGANAPPPAGPLADALAVWRAAQDMAVAAHSLTGAEARDLDENADRPTPAGPAWPGRTSD